MSENEVERLMTVAEPPVDTDRALAQIRARIEREGIRPTVATVRRTRADGAIVSIWIKGLAAAASVALIAVLLTASGVAETILTIFEPKQVVAVPITASDFSGATGFAQYGTLVWSTPPQPIDVPDLATAERESGMKVLRATLPARVNPTKARYGVMPRTTATS